MKKIFLSVLVLTGVLFSSCEKDLLVPFTPGSITDDLITTSADLQRLMNSSYAIYTNRSEMVFTSVMTDEVGIGFANGGQGIQDEFIFFLNPNSGAASALWSQTYICLSRINRVINFSNTIVGTSPADVQLIRRLRGEALVLRAMCYIRIISYFSPDPKSNTALAGVNANRIVTVSEPLLQRVTNGVFYAQIHKDLDDAILVFNGLTADLVPYPAAARTYYPNVNLARAMKARAFGLKGDYPNAEIWANAVINTSGISLATFANYNNIWFTDNEPANTEVIFRLRRTQLNSAQGSNIGAGWASVDATIAGSPFYEIGRSLFNALPALDIRRATIVAPSSIIDPNYATSADFRTTDKLVLGKYRGTAASLALNADFKMCRLSEMYFLRAEARVAAGDLVGAAIAVETVIDNRFAVNQPLPVYANATAAWKAILDQRRIEFAFEGYRFIDLKRIGALANAGIDRDPADWSSTSNNFPGANPINFPLTSFKFALPIPVDELNANPSIQQNAGY